MVMARRGRPAAHRAGEFVAKQRLVDHLVAGVPAGDTRPHDDGIHRRARPLAQTRPLVFGAGVMGIASRPTKSIAMLLPDR